MQQQFETQHEEEEARRLGYEPEEYREIVRRAERIRSERGERLTREELAESAAELGITEQDLKEAEHELQAEKQQQAALAEKKKKQLRLGGMVAAGALAFSLFVGTISYNGLSARYAAVNEARANLTSVLQRKADLLPQVGNLVRGGAAKQELQQTALAMRSGSLEEQLKANAASNELLKDADTASSDILASMMISSLEGAENRISVARTRYAGVARYYNETARSFPGNLVVTFTGFPSSVPTYESGR